MRKKREIRTMGYDSGLLSDKQALHIVGLKGDGGTKKEKASNPNKGELPREKSTENESKPNNE
jgi:hypothetical protein